MTIGSAPVLSTVVAGVDRLQPAGEDPGAARPGASSLNRVHRLEDGLHRTPGRHSGSSTRCRARTAGTGSSRSPHDVCGTTPAAASHLPTNEWPDPTALPRLPRTFLSRASTPPHPSPTDPTMTDWGAALPRARGRRRPRWPPTSTTTSWPRRCPPAPPGRSSDVDRPPGRVARPTASPGGWTAPVAGPAWTARRVGERTGTCRWPTWWPRCGRNAGRSGDAVAGRVRDPGARLGHRGAPRRPARGAGQGRGWPSTCGSRWPT